MRDIETTIAAISTAPGTGGIAVVRISGKEAFSICDKLFFPAAKTSLSAASGYTILFGKIKEKDTVVDEVLVSIFQAPNSFTGENVVEISCHGSLYIQQKIMQLLLENGAVLAQPGEFTQRAFLHGKMDLSQAEAVADLIASNAAAAHRLAMNQMRGGFSKELAQLRAQLLEFTSLIELELDFSEEEVEFADRSRLNQLVNGIIAKITVLVNSFQAGNAIKNGIPVAIVGETNAGKSTLLNTLLNEDKAIVSDIHGTTRDVIEDTITLKGVLFRFIDTAGIRETTDAIETLGIEKTFRKINQASVVLWIIDGTGNMDNICTLKAQMESLTKDKILLPVINKSDLIDREKEKQFNQLFKQDNLLFISAKKRMNTITLEEQLVNAANLPDISKNDVIVTNVRHYEALKKALSAIERVRTGLESGISGDFLSQDIREGIYYLGEITGEISTDEVLGNIFKNFCIGK